MLWRDNKVKTQQDDNLTELGLLFKEEFVDMDKYVQLIKDIIIGMPPDKIKEPKKAFLYQVRFLSEINKNVHEHYA